METTQKQIVLGILAHVDSGKTTLSEAMLYRAGVTRRLGRVDHKDAFLDTDALEKARGITIFSKQALLTAGETAVTLLDTPGHVDFSTETERTAGRGEQPVIRQALSLSRESLPGNGNILYHPSDGKWGIVPTCLPIADNRYPTILHPRTLRHHPRNSYL